VAHSILVIAWHLLTRNQPYTDLGADYFLERQTSEAYRNRLVRQLERRATRSPWSRPRSPDPVLHQGHWPLDGDFQPRHIRGMRSCWSGEDDQLVGGLDVTVVVRCVPGQTASCCCSPSMQDWASGSSDADALGGVW
jgi:hypothetical protein